METIIESLPAVFFAKDVEGRHRMVNVAARDIWHQNARYLAPFQVAPSATKLR
jgi:hypothetical protein